MRKILFFVFLAAAASLDARVVREAPDFRWMESSGKTRTLNSLRGQPVVLIIAPSPLDWAFRSQVGQLQQVYERLASSGAVCFAAFTGEEGRIKSNIPFVIAPDGPQVGFLYDVPEEFGIAIIGEDGNLDLVSDRVVPGQRVLDIINNSFAIQTQLRRD